MKTFVSAKVSSRVKVDDRKINSSWIGEEDASILVGSANITAKELVPL